MSLHAATPFRAVLDKCTFHTSPIPVYANTTAQPYPADENQARDLLANQLARPVEFVAQIEQMYRDGVRLFVEAGPGARLTALVDAILGDRDHQALSLDASNGQRSGFYDLACCLAWLAALGQQVQLSLWDDGDKRLRELPADNGKPAFTVTLSGANYVKPKPKRPPVAPPPQTSKGVVSYNAQTTNGPLPGVSTPKMNRNSSPPPPSVPPPQPCADG